MFVLSTPQENVSKLITISQLDSILSMAPTLKDARDILLQIA
jgi:hypothetical protein